MGLKNLPLRALARLTRSTFMDCASVSVFRMTKQFDDVGGDSDQINWDEPVIKDAPCYFSQHPWYVTKTANQPAAFNTEGNWRIHMEPDCDVRTGDVLKIHLDNGCDFTYIVNKVAYYPIHVRVELGEWEPNKASAINTGWEW